MVSNPRTSFLDEEPDVVVEEQYEGSWSCGTSEGSRIWCNRTDTMGIIMAGLALAVLTYGEFVVLWVVLETNNFPFCNAIIYSALSVMAAWAHLKTMLTEPGVVPRAAMPLREEDGGGPGGANHTLCGRCEAYKPVRAHHCRLCGRCVVRMDHHCPWMNNCVGAGNQKQFLLFLFYTLATSGYALGLVLYHFIQCVVDASICEKYSTLTAYLIRALLLLACAVTLFTLSMIMNQFHGIMTGMGTVDRMQRRRKEGRIRGRLEDFTPVRWEDIFGSGSRLTWFLPTNPHFQASQRQRIMGFREPPVSRRHDYEDV